MRKIFTLITAFFLITGSSKAAELWTGTATTGNWGNTEGTYVTVNKDVFSSVAAGNIIKITISDFNTTDATYWQYALKQSENGWNYLPNFVDGNLTQNAENACYCLTADDASALNNYGLVVQGYYITISKIELLTTTEPVEIYNGGGMALTGETYGTSTYLNEAYQSPNKFGGAFKNDFICITYTCTAESAEDYDSYLKIGNPSGWGNYSPAARKGLSYNNSGTFTYQIADINVLEGIQLTGAIVFGQKVTITKVELLKSSNRYDAVPVTIGGDGLATFSTSSKKLDFNGTGITPYYASSYSEGIVNLTPVTRYTYGWQGYILSGTEGAYEIPVVAASDDYTDYPSTNHLKPIGDNSGEVTASTEGKNHYIFAKKKNENAETIGFYKLTAAHTLAAHKAYLETDTDITPTGASTRGITLDFGNGTTAIYDVFQDETNQNITREDNVYYTLMGTRVQNPSKGLYILNGKKVLVK